MNVHDSALAVLRDALVVVVAAAAGLGGPKTVMASEPVINESCPVMTLEKADPKITMVYNDRTIAFCCDRCLSKFVTNPEKYVGNLPQLADHAGSSNLPSRGKHEHGEPEERSDGQAGNGGEIRGAAAHDHDGHDGVGKAGDDEREPLRGRLHPVFVHFPLAGLPLALLGFLAWLMTGREAFAKADVLPLFAASLAAIAAVITGNIAHDVMRFGERLHRIVEQHQLASTTAMVLSVSLSAFRIWRWNGLRGPWRHAYAGGLVATCVLLGITGYLGGSLVFGPDHLQW